MKTEDLLQERGKSHGDFTIHARITQRLMDMVTAEPGWLRLTEPQKEATHMIFHKIGRAVAGDANFADHWDDIAGYAKLVSNRCKENENANNVDPSVKQADPTAQGNFFGGWAVGLGGEGSSSRMASVHFDEYGFPHISCSND